MNFSHVSFNPSSFVSMHQLNPAGAKFVGTIQRSLTLIPATPAQSHQSNHENFSNNVPNTSTDASLQTQHHYQEAPGRFLNFDGSARQINPQSTVSTAAQTWTESNHPGSHDSMKSSLPIFSPHLQSHTLTQTDHTKIRSTEMHSVSTMTDFEISINNENKIFHSKLSDSCEDSNDSLKCSRDENNLFRSSFCSNSCSKVNLKGSASAMAVYLDRLKPSQIPPVIEDFLKKHNIKVNSFKTKQSNSNKDYEDSSRNDSEAGLRLSTAFDGSLLYCCSECQVAYPQKEQLDRHLIVHKVERRFECNVCGVCLKRKEHLDQHKRGHSEERPFVCEICCKGFKRNEHLRRHVVIHSGDKSHVCTQCGKAFSRKDHLTKHLQTHLKKQAKNEANDSVPSLLPAQTQKNLDYSLQPKQTPS